MMFDRIKRMLTDSGVTAWELTEYTKNSWEFYFIRHELDQNRVVETKDYKIKLYVTSEDGAFLGSASAEISPTATDAEIVDTIARVKYQASLIKNPVYTITDRKIEVPDQTDPVDVASIAASCMKVMRSLPETPEVDINSYEIFVSECRRRTLNSNGVAYTCIYPSTEMEVVVNARKEGHEIELHRIYTSGSCDEERLREDIARVMQFGKDRLRAGPTPKIGKGDVLFSTSDAAAIYDYFADRMFADYKVRQISDWEVGQPVAKDMKGDKVTVEVVPALPNSSMNMPVDKEGCEVYPRYLIKDGIAKEFCGSRQFAQYLGLERSSLVPNLVISGGTHTEEELREGDYLEVVEFSDFQVDSMSGDIAGEIRLAYYHHDGVTEVVTGGSVSGSMAEAVPRMLFSKEQVQYDTKVIPRITLLRGLRITGVE